MIGTAMMRAIAVRSEPAERAERPERAEHGAANDGARAERTDRRRTHRAETNNEAEAPRTTRKRQESIGDMIAALMAGKPLTPVPTATKPRGTDAPPAGETAAAAAAAATARNAAAALPDQILATQVQTQAQAQAPAQLPAQAQAQDAASPSAKPATAATPATTEPGAAAATTAPARTAAAAAASLPSMTALEAVVHDLIERAFADKPHRDSILGAETASSAEPAAVLPAGAAPLATAAAGPTPTIAVTTAAATTPSIAEPLEIEQLSAETAVQRLRMVVGEDANRIVISVAVRGATVDVSLRAHDDVTAAALARNLGTLDHALRARGLELGDPSPDHDSDSDDRDRRRAPHRDRRSQEETS